MVVINSFSLVGKKVFNNRVEAEQYLDENHREAMHFEKGVLVSADDFMNDKELINKLINNGYLEYTEFEVIEPFEVRKVKYKQGELVSLNIFKSLFGIEALEAIMYKVEFR